MSDLAGWWWLSLWVESLTLWVESVLSVWVESWSKSLVERMQMDYSLPKMDWS